MNYEGSAYTPDKFIPMLIKELSLLNEFAWNLMHNLNGAADNITVVANPDFTAISENLKDSPSSHVYFYKKHPAINEIYLHSEYLPWNLVRLTYTASGEYSYKVLFRN